MNELIIMVIGFVLAMPFIIVFLIVAYKKIKKRFSKIRCECNEVGLLKSGMESMYDSKEELPFVNHKPNECKCTNNLQRYSRDGKKVWLCSCCCLISDKLIIITKE